MLNSLLFDICNIRVIIYYIAKSLTHFVWAAFRNVSMAWKSVQGSRNVKAVVHGGRKGRNSFEPGSGEKLERKCWKSYLDGKCATKRSLGYWSRRHQRRQVRTHRCLEWDKFWRLFPLPSPTPPPPPPTFAGILYVNSARLRTSGYSLWTISLTTNLIQVPVQTLLP